MIFGGLCFFVGVAATLWYVGYKKAQEGKDTSEWDSELNSLDDL